MKQAKSFINHFQSFWYLIKRSRGHILSCPDAFYTYISRFTLCHNVLFNKHCLGINNMFSHSLPLKTYAKCSLENMAKFTTIHSLAASARWCAGPFGQQRSLTGLYCMSQSYNLLPWQSPALADSHWSVGNQSRTKRAMVKSGNAWHRPLDVACLHTVGACCGCIQSQHYFQIWNSFICN